MTDDNIIQFPDFLDAKSEGFERVEQTIRETVARHGFRLTLIMLATEAQKYLVEKPFGARVPEEYMRKAYNLAGDVAAAAAIERATKESNP
jgi:hypothetical protein